MLSWCMPGVSNGQIRVLHVGDEPDTVAVADRLAQAHEKITVITETEPSAAVPSLEENSPISCVMSAYNMTGMDGLELFFAVRDRYDDLPFILLTRQEDDEVISKAVSAGVTEYFYKRNVPGQYAALANRIERVVTEQRAPEALSDSEESPSSLFGSFPCMVYRVQTDGGRLMERVNADCAVLTGYDAGALESGEVSWHDDVIHEDDRGDVWDSVQEGLDTDGPFRVTYRIETADGESRWLSEKGRAINNTGRVESVVTDISEQKRRESRLETFRTLVQNVADPMYVLDENGTVEMANEAMAAHLGHDIEEIVGATPETFMPDSGVRRGDEVIHELLQEGTDSYRTWEMDAVREDGKRIRNEVKTSIIYDESGEFVGSAGVIRDITERKQRERELERYETIIQAVGDPVYTLDEEGKFTFVNDAFKSMMGYDASELLGEHVSQVLVEEAVERGTEVIERLLQTDDVQTSKYELTAVTAEGEEIPCEIQLTLLPYDESFSGTAGVVRDITERKVREERLEEFAGVVAHDLRGPLNLMLSRAELAHETGNDEHFRKVLEAIERMDTLIDDLLTLAKQGQTVGETGPVKLQQIAERAWRNVDTGAATLKVDSNPTLEADQHRLQEALENLFKNSIEHGSEGSYAQAADSSARSAAVSVAVRVGSLDERDGFFVADDGPGISPDKQDTIFDRGFTTESNGTGFGLSIVERIVEAHDWQINVTDSKHGGARFEILTE